MSFMDLACPTKVEQAYHHTPIERIATSATYGVEVGQRTGNSGRRNGLRPTPLS